MYGSVCVCGGREVVVLAKENRQGRRVLWGGVDYSCGQSGILDFIQWGLEGECGDLVCKKLLGVRRWRGVFLLSSFYSSQLSNRNNVIAALFSRKLILPPPPPPTPTPANRITKKVLFLFSSPTFFYLSPH